MCALTTPTYKLVYSSYCILISYIATTHKRPFYKTIIASSKYQFTSTINHRSLRNQSAHSKYCSHARDNHCFDASLLSSNSTVSSPNKWGWPHTRNFFFTLFFRLYNFRSSQQIKEKWKRSFVKYQQIIFVCSSVPDIHSFSDLGVSSNLIGSLFRGNWALFTLQWVTNAWSLTKRLWRKLAFRDVNSIDFELFWMVIIQEFSVYLKSGLEWMNLIIAF